MLKIVTIAGFASATQAALTCATDAYCKDVDSTKPYCVNSSATASACVAASGLKASAANCFKTSTATQIQCVATDYCPSATGVCTTKIAATNALVGNNHSCKSGNNDATTATNCGFQTDADCASENSAMPYLVNSAASTAACAAAPIALGANCFKTSTADQVQCAASSTCTGATGKCHALTDAACTPAASGYIKASASAASACGTLIVAGQPCFKKSTADAMQCASGNQCPANSVLATNLCVALTATGSACTNNVECASNNCVSSLCTASSAPTTTTKGPTVTTTAPTKTTTTPTATTKAPTKAAHSDASAITASAFVVASTVFASSVFA